ncbi:GAF domain-containing sensor histidine kinase [Nocardioides sp. ChNu-99]|uniref:sensor histidine kinase n=1 Tax=Nocardioides sp. ChNu-99 TaxID=2839897 RepID=UPI002407019E|nr:GAF domain-containing sensor histidine kinase [Nocardioides sp. ChNu-99]MDF9715950.1 GAF domain-containing sensor histidine kinase [Nocardioides sp. ChNu-99]
MGQQAKDLEEAIDRYGLLDPPPREVQAVVEMAAFVARVPLATVNVITSTQQHQIATVGFDASICRREDSMCAVTVELGSPVVVPDARLDERFSANPFVDGRINTVRFYAAHPLRTQDDVVIGTLCVFDTEPRELDETQRLALSTLADRVVDTLELSRRARALDASLRRTEEMRDELARSNEHLAAFAGQVSHDLRNPLSTVAMSLYLLQEQLEEQGGARTVDRALRGTKRMEALIEDLLAFARVGGTLRRDDVDLGQVVAAVLGDLDGALSGASVTVGELPTVCGDATQLRAVLQNLVANAAKFTRPSEPAAIDVAGRRVDGGWRIEVADRGLGIAPEDAGRVFEPLVRLDTQADGSGIGLATCRRVVEAHGGRIGLEPREGGGTVAWVELPDS